MRVYDSKFGYVLARIATSGQWQPVQYFGKLSEARRAFKGEIKIGLGHDIKIVLAAGDNNFIIDVYEME